MKVGPRLTTPEVPLPTEVLHTILRFVQQFRDFVQRTQALWSFCLVSKPWYTVGISALYEAPVLTNRNFDKFARTLCPPVNSHVRHVGLETLVKRLHLGNLAYESTRSLTARLLRRTRQSLEVFVAPAVTFSVTALAPLSKCSKLRSLDLSKDFYDIELTRLLHSIRCHENLIFLSLPKNSLGATWYGRRQELSRSCSWPPNLKHLQINAESVMDKEHWIRLMGSFPTSLLLFSVQSPQDYMIFEGIDEGRLTSASVTHVNIGSQRVGESKVPLCWVLQGFSQVKFLTLPFKDAPLVHPETIKQISFGESLEEIIFTLSPTVYPPNTARSIDLVGNYVHAFPRLKRIEIPMLCLPLDNENAMEDLDAYEDEMIRRKNENETEFAGILVIE